MNGNVAMTIKYPTMYHGVLCPNLLENLSEKYPTRGVHIESTTWPTRNVTAAASVFATVTKKNREKLNWYYEYLNQ